MSLNEAMASSRLNTNTTTSTSTSISSIRSIRSDGGVSTSTTSCMPSSSSSWCVGMGVSIGAATAAAAAAAAFVYYKYYYKHNAKKSDRRSVVDSKRTETGGENTQQDVKTENKENKDEKDEKEEKDVKEVIPEEELMDFENACEFVTHSSLVSSNIFEQRELLELYGLYKQATLGDCPEKDNKASAGSFSLGLNLKEKKKREYWSVFSGMSRRRATHEYVGRVLAKRKQIGADDEESDDLNGSGGGSQWGITSSILRDPYEDEDDEGEGEDTSITPLHWAVDRGDLHRVTKLIAMSETKGMLHATDRHGQTPLHYAALCQYKDIYDALVEAGGDETKEDNDGETPMQLRQTSEDP